jgi:peptidylprolyl isomerase
VQEKTRFWRTDPLSNTIIMKLKSGPVKIELRPDLAPNHVARITELTKDGFYDGIVFHRVIPGFMAQTGDPTGTGTGGSKKPNLKAEFSRERHVRGTCSMARSGSPDSANSQFFICFDDASWLDGNYTVWGKVVEGMEHIDAVKKGDNSSGTVVNPDKIISMTLP